MYTSRNHRVRAVRWNNPNFKGYPLDARECQDHPAVAPTDYMEVCLGLGSFGSSVETPFWEWQVMGTVQTSRGKVFVCPGDWIVDYPNGMLRVLTPAQFAYEFVEL